MSNFILVGKNVRPSDKPTNRLTNRPRRRDCLQRSYTSYNFVWLRQVCWSPRRLLPLLLRVSWLRPSRTGQPGGATRQGQARSQEEVDQLIGRGWSCWGRREGWRPQKAISSQAKSCTTQVMKMSLMFYHLETCSIFISHSWPHSLTHWLIHLLTDSVTDFSLLTSGCHVILYNAIAIQ